MAVVLGYQLVTVSPALPVAERAEANCKLVAFELMHKSRLIGGDAACAVVLAPALDKAASDKVWRELHTDTGLQMPVRIWSSQAKLEDEIRLLLNRLEWK